MRQIECPYYIINNEEELQTVRALWNYKVERLHDFPFIIGKEPGFIFQSEGSNHPIEDYWDAQEIYSYRHIPVPNA